MVEPPCKRQRSTEYGKNPLGIIIAREGKTPPWAVCNVCKKRVTPGQRIMKDDQFSWPEMWWNHLECAKLHLFVEDGCECTPATVASMPAQCAWCAQDIICNWHQWHANWMGWTHAHCNVGDMSDFVDILRTLQRKYPVETMPTNMHSWRNVEELTTWAGIHGSIVSQSEAPSAAEGFTIRPDPEDCESIDSDLDSQATEVYEPVVGPITPAQPVRGAARG